LVVEVVARVGLERMYSRESDFFTRPEIVSEFPANARTLGDRFALRTMLLSSQGSALRNAGADENCVFAFCGLQFPGILGEDEREIGIACMSRPQAAAFERLLEIGKGRLETYAVFEEMRFDEEVTRDQLLRELPLE
jgi:hypothetical protein